MKVNLAVAGAVILVFALVATGVYWVYQRQVVSPQKESQVQASPTGKFPTSKDATSTPSVLPEAGSNTIDVKNIGILVTLPQANKPIASPVKVTGFANVPEGQIIIRINDALGNNLGNGVATSCMDLESCPFEASVVFAKPQISTGAIEVFSPSPQDGSEKYLQTIPVGF